MFLSLYGKYKKHFAKENIKLLIHKNIHTAGHEYNGSLSNTLVLDSYNTVFLFDYKVAGDKT